MLHWIQPRCMRSKNSAKSQLLSSRNYTEFVYLHFSDWKYALLLH